MDAENYGPLNQDGDFCAQCVQTPESSNWSLSTAAAAAVDNDQFEDSGHTESNIYALSHDQEPQVLPEP